MGTVSWGSFSHECVPDPVDYVTVSPRDHDTAGLPLLLMLHGGGSSATSTADLAGLLDLLWASGELPPMVVATASTPTGGGFYTDVDDGSGRWEELVSVHFRRLIVEALGADDDCVALLGVSMGGYGSLKLAFRHPDRYRCVAALEPALFPADDAAALSPRNSVVLDAPLARFAAAGPDGFRRNSPAHLAGVNAESIRASRLAVFLECGDDDALLLHDGAEFLHRRLWELDIRHEYRLILDGDHLGPTIGPRIMDALRFVGRTLRRREHPIDTGTLAPQADAWIAWMDAGTTGPMPVIDSLSQAAANVLRFRTARLLRDAGDAHSASQYLPLGDPRHPGT